MTVTRAMVPILLCFDVHHEDGATEEQVSEQIRNLVTRNLGEIGEEDNNIQFPFEDQTGRNLDAAIYPSNYRWCDTFAHARPDWECSQDEPLPIFAPVINEPDRCAHCGKLHSEHKERARC